jgi:hypothetical protein
MSEQQIIQSPAKPRRQDARDLQSRLYREIGLAAVAAELIPSEAPECEAIEIRSDRSNLTVVRVGGRAA